MRSSMTEWAAMISVFVLTAAGLGMSADWALALLSGGGTLLRVLERIPFLETGNYLNSEGRATVLVTSTQTISWQNLKGSS